MRSMAEGSHLSSGAVLEGRWDPSVASHHLPVPGRIYVDPAASKHYNDLVMCRS